MFVTTYHNWFTLSWLVFFALCLAPSMKAQWRGPFGPTGGTVVDLIPQGNEMFAVVWGGTYWSNNDGASWRSLNSARKGVSDAARNGKTFYIVVLGRLQQCDSADLMWRTTMVDGSNSMLQGVVANNDAVYVTTTRGQIYRTIDNGSSWSNVGFARDDTTTRTTKLITIGHRLLAYDSERFFITDNGGESWIQTDTVFDGATLYTLFASNSGFFACTSNGLFSSNDSGESWASYGNTVPDIKVKMMLNVGKSFIVKGPSGTYISQDSGSKWQRIEDNMNVANAWSMSSTSSAMVVGTISDMYRSTDSGVSWISANTGLVNRPVFNIAYNQGRLLAGTAAGVTTSEDQGNTWSEVKPGTEGQFISVVAAKGNRVYACPDSGGILISDDNGETFHHLPSTTGRGTFSALFIIGNSIVTNVISNPSVSFKLRSPDGGLTWETKIRGYYANEIKTVATVGDVAYMGSERLLFISNDSGASWGQLHRFTWQNVMALCANNRVVVASTPDAMYRSTDMGYTWTTFSLLGQDNRARGMLAYRNYIIASDSKQAIHISSDDGLTWSTLAGPLADGHINQIAVGDSVLFAATAHGVYSLSLSNLTTSVSDTPKQPPSKEFSVTCSPSPITNSARISFVLPFEARVTVSIYNIYGTVVSTITSDQFSAGKHGVSWHLNSEPNGLYFCRVQADLLQGADQNAVVSHPVVVAR